MHSSSIPDIQLLILFSLNPQGIPTTRRTAIGAGIEEDRDAKRPSFTTGHGWEAPGQPVCVKFARHACTVANNRQISAGWHGSAVHRRRQSSSPQSKTSPWIPLVWFRARPAPSFNSWIQDIFARPSVIIQARSFTPRYRQQRTTDLELKPYLGSLIMVPDPESSTAVRSGRLQTQG